MKTILWAFVFVFIGNISLFANENIEPTKITFALSRDNRANVVRLMNDRKNVRYFLEVFTDAWQIDSPDSQTGGALCIRINRAGGRYLPGCLMCRKHALKTYLPFECSGVFSKAMLEDGLKDAAKGLPITLAGQGMRITILLKKLEFSKDPVPPPMDPLVKYLDFEMSFEPDPNVPSDQRFSRVQ